MTLLAGCWWEIKAKMHEKKKERYHHRARWWHKSGGMTGDMRCWCDESVIDCTDFQFLSTGNETFEKLSPKNWSQSSDSRVAANIFRYHILKTNEVSQEEFSSSLYIFPLSSFTDFMQNSSRQHISRRKGQCGSWSVVSCLGHSHI